MGDTFSSWQQEHSPDRKEVRVCFNRELLYEFEQAHTELARLKESDEGMLDVADAVTAAELRVEDLKEQIRAAQKTLVFESIGTKPWRDLLSEHPPIGEHRNVVTILGLPLDYNPDSFVPIAISKTCVEPEISLEQAEWFCSSFPVSEVDRVFGAVLTCNNTGLDRPFDDTGSPLAGVKR